MTPLKNFHTSCKYYLAYNSLQKLEGRMFLFWVKNSLGAVITSAGLQVDSNFSVSFYDDQIEGMTTVFPVVSITNYEYEENLQNDRRNIIVLKSKFLTIIKDDLEEMMEYKKGSTQYKSETLKTADNIRLFQ